MIHVEGNCPPQAASASAEIRAAALALELAARGRWLQAERLCQGVLAIKPSSVVLLALVEILVRRGRWKEAFRRLAEQRPRFAVAKNADDMAAAYRLAVLAADPEGARRWGEALLDRSRLFCHIEILTRPFFTGEFDFMRLPRGFLEAQLTSFDRATARSPSSPWPRFLRLALRALCGQAMDERQQRRDIQILSRVAPRRYGWMRGLIGQQCLINEKDYRGAERDFRAAAGCSRPADWTALCFLGETLICLGRRRQGLEAFRKAYACAPAGSKADALAWQGEMRLWLGRAREALLLLERAVAEGAIYAEGWKGGCLVLLGRYEEAIACLDRAIERTPHDGESRTWKAEAFLRLGQPRRALAEADQALAGYRRYTGFYLLAIRGLASRALGNDEGPRQVVRNVPKAVRDFVGARVVGARGASSSACSRLLEGLLRLSRGVRRDGHELAAWMHKT